MKKLIWTVLAVLALYMLYDYVRLVNTGVEDPTARMVGQVSGQILGFYLWYVALPMFIFKRIRRLIFGKPTASVAAPQPPDLAIDMTG